jgi:L-fuconolactonase
MEEALEPELPICDAHHHLWPLPVESQYLLDAFLADTATGHHVVSSVYIEARSAYLDHGPERFRPVGETEFVVELAEVSAARGGTEIAGIIGHADLRLGDGVEHVLTRHMDAGHGRFRGIRHATAWDPHLEIYNSQVGAPRGLMNEPDFRRGLEVLADMGLVFEAWLYHPQLPEMIDAARAVPTLTVVVDHLGGPLGIPPYQDDESAGAEWRRGIEELATCDNVHMKLGGIGMPLFGPAWPGQPTGPTSAELAALWQEKVAFCIDMFGPDRCMFESNFPVDRFSLSYVVLWNAFKLMTQDRNARDRASLFRDTATRVYRLPTRA